MRQQSLRTIISLSLAVFAIAIVQSQGNDLAAKLTQIERTVEKKRKELGVPGASMLIMIDGKVVYMKGLGYRDLEKKLPVTPNTLFGIGSSTKAFTALEMGMAVDDGLLKWSDHPRKYLPYFKLWDKDANDKFTITDMLCHRSGLNRTDILWIEDRLSREEAIRALQYVKPTLPFRAGFQYQNIMFAGAGEIVGKVYNSSWEQVTRDRIFKPLEMTSSNVSIAELEKVADRAKGYSLSDGEAVFTPYRSVVSCGPAGSINSNAVDMAKWLQYVMSGTYSNGKRLVSEETYKEWFAPKTMVAPGNMYALGWFVRQWQDKKLIEHAGNIDGFNAQVGFLPDEKIGFVMLTNVGASELPSFAMETVWKNLLGEKKDPRQTNDPQVDPQKEVGIYGSKDIPIKLNVTIDGKKLSVTPTGQPKLALVSLGGRVYKFAPPAPDGIYLTFRPDEKDATKTEVLLEQSGAKIVFKREDSSYTSDISVEELTNKMARALGGEKGLGSIKSLETRAEMVIAGQGITGVNNRHMLGNRYLEEVQFFAMNREVASLQTVFDGKHAAVNQISRFVEVKGKALDDLKIENDNRAILDPLKYFKEVKITGKEKYRNEDVYVLQKTRASGTVTTEYVSAKSFLVLKKETAASTDEYYDYRKVGGTTMPFLIRSTNPLLGSVLITVSSVKVNAKVDPKLFSIDRIRALSTHVKTQSPRS